MHEDGLCSLHSPCTVCSTELSNIDSLIFQAWPTEITCILISSAHQPTSCVQMRWNVSHTHTTGFFARICPLNMLLQHSLMDVYAPSKKMEPSRLLLQEGINQPAPPMPLTCTTQGRLIASMLEKHQAVNLITVQY